MSKQITRLVLIFALMAGSSAAQTNTFPGSGNVGIGTTSPGTPLQVVGTGNVVALGEANNSSGKQIVVGVSTAGDGYGSIQVMHQGVAWTPLMLNPSGGNVGIGTTAPAATLDVGNTDGGGALETVLARLGEGNGTGDGTYLGVKGWDTSTATSTSFSLEHHFYGLTNSSINFHRGVSSTGGFLTFATNNNTEQMRIDPSGNVGIGTTSPGEKLEVGGNLKLSSGGSHIHFVDGTDQSTAWTGTLTGGDYAESMDVTGSREEYEPGDVLVLDPEHPGKVVKSSDRYSLAVSGVYSTKPGVVGRRQKIAKELATTEVSMAMVGAVPTKATAENGPIKPGDVLVTSSKSGYAMKGTDRSLFAGAVIGKAMGSLDSGTGVIEALISLQ